MESGHPLTADKSWAHHPDHDLEAATPLDWPTRSAIRILILDDRGTPTLELLRFRRTLTTFPGFEVALRRRVERLRHFRHPSFARTPAVEYLGQERSLALLSNHTAGRRLSEVLAHAQDPALAASLIHQLTPALDALHDYGEGVGHGALTASRVVIAPEGQLIVVEHALGIRGRAAAHDGSGDPPRSRDSGTRDGNGISADRWSNRLFPARPDCALDASWACAAQRRIFGSRRDVERRAFASRSGIRRAAFRAARVARACAPTRARVSRPEKHGGTARSRDARPCRQRAPMADAAGDSRRGRRRSTAGGRAVGAARRSSDRDRRGCATARRRAHAPPVAVGSFPAETHVHTQPAPDRPRSSFFPATNGYLRWALVAVALCAIVEAFVIARLLAGRGSISPPPAVTQVNLVTNDPGAPVMVDGRLAGVTPLDLSINSRYAIDQAWEARSR